jgi:hypothetical protein
MLSCIITQRYQLRNMNTNSALVSQNAAQAAPNNQRATVNDIRASNQLPTPRSEITGMFRWQQTTDNVTEDRQRRMKPIGNLKTIIQHYRNNWAPTEEGIPAVKIENPVFSYAAEYSDDHDDTAISEVDEKKIQLVPCDPITCALICLREHKGVQIAVHNFADSTSYSSNLEKGYNSTKEWMLVTTTLLPSLEGAASSFPLGQDDVLYTKNASIITQNPGVNIIGRDYTVNIISSAAPDLKKGKRYDAVLKA